MNGQDITRSVIRLELTRALRGMETSPKRTLRKLADLGKLCAKGTIQKEMFGIFQKRLKNPDSPYFSSIETLVKQVSGDALLTFGMNLGYNSWTYGVRRLRETPADVQTTLSFLGLLSFSEDASWDTESLMTFIEENKKSGIYAYAILPYYKDPDGVISHLLAETAAKETDCAFLWFFPEESLTDRKKEAFTLPNIMPVFSMQMLKETDLSSYLLENQILYGIYQKYDLHTEQEVISRKMLGLLSSFHTPFLFFLSDDADTSETSVVSRFSLDARIRQAYPFLPVDFYSDINRIDRLIFGESHPLTVQKHPSSVSLL